MNRSLASLVLTLALLGSARAWIADNGNGTFSNPLFYDEFSDPDLIRVGDDFYLTGTTMHTMPGLPVLHSKDLVNWELLTYACDQLDLGPEFRLEDGRDVYGQGFWAPSFRYRDGTFYIFSNVNRHNTQVFRARNPAGPWEHSEMKRSLHDLSVLLDDDGKAYVVWGYRDVHFAQLTEDLTDIVPGTERSLFERDSGMGEGSHFYKINGKYFITSAWFAGRMRMACARADKPEGPYEVNQAISMNEDFGINEGYRLRGQAPPFNVVPPNFNDGGRMSLHQGGVVDTPTGEWWGFSMMDYNSVGRLTCLSPITWKDGWPYFGLPGNLKRTPRIWVKPNTGHSSPPSAPYQRDDDFSGPTLANVWQWNHVPDDAMWSLVERPGYLRLHSLPATNFWHARNTLTQRSIGPESMPCTELDASGMQPGDVAGLALLNFPYAWIGVERTVDGLVLEQYNEYTDKMERTPLQTQHVWLRAHCDFLKENATFSYSTNGEMFEAFGGEFEMVFQLRTFQGIRYSLFHYNTGGLPGGYADFNQFRVYEPRPRGLTKPIPLGKVITLASVADGSVLVASNQVLRTVPASNGLTSGKAAQFTVVDRGLGRVSLQSVADDLYVNVISTGGAESVVLKEFEHSSAQVFQWEEMPRGDLMLLSLASDRNLWADPSTGVVAADNVGPKPDRKDGSCFQWKVVGE